MNLARSNTR